MERLGLLFLAAVFVPTSNAICSSPTGNCNCNVVFLLDISGSVSGNTDASGQSEMSNLKRFTRDMVDRYYNIPGNVNVGIVTFENGATKVASLGLSRSDVKSKVNGIQPTLGYTNYIAALEIGKEMLKSISKPGSYIDSMILVTDGQPTVMSDGSKVDENDLSSSAILKRDNTKMHIKSMVDDQKKDPNFKMATVRVSRTSDKAAAFLKTLASSPELALREEYKANSLYFEDFADLNDAAFAAIKARLVDFTCAEQSKDTVVCPNGANSGNRCNSRTTCPNNEICHGIGQSGADGVCCPAQTCGISPICHCNIGFLLDISGSVSGTQDHTGRSEIDNLKIFTKDMVNRYYKLAAADVNVGVITFDNFASTKAQLGNSKNKVIQGIDGIAATNGWTNYIDALFRQKSMFENFNHGTPYMDSVILVTDGEPTVTKDGERISEDDMRPYYVGLRNEMKGDIKKIIDDQRKNRNDPNPFNLLIIRVSMTSPNATRFLQSLASETGDAVWKSGSSSPSSLEFEDFAALNNLNANTIKEQIIESTCKTRDPGRVPDCGEVIVLADMSGSIEQNNVDMVKNALFNLFGDNEMMNRKASLLAFSDNVVTMILPPKFRSSSDQNEVRNLIQQKLFTGGWTGMANALQFIERNTQTGGKLIIMLTDGFPTIMINGHQVEEFRPLNERKPVMDEVHRMKSRLVDQQAKFAAVCLVGTKGCDRDFLDLLIGEDNVSELASYVPYSNEFKLRDLVVSLIQRHCPK